jgi:hypothetical protein
MNKACIIIIVTLIFLGCAKKLPLETVKPAVLPSETATATCSITAACTHTITSTATITCTPVASVAGWGNAGSGNGQFQNIRGIAADASANVYVIDSGLNTTGSYTRTQKFNADGTYLMQWPGITAGADDFEYASGIAAGGGYVYITDSQSGRLIKFTDQGIYVNSVDLTDIISGVTIDKNGDILIVKGDESYYETHVARYNSGLEFQNEWGYNWGCVGIAVDSMNDCYVVSGHSTQQKYTETGTFIYSRYFSEWATGFAVDPSDNCFVVLQNKYTVFKYSAAGDLLKSWDKGFVAGKIAINSGGFIFVAGANQVRVFSPQ